MMVGQIWAREPWTCPVDATLVDVARATWDGDCGTLPIVDGAGRVVGMFRIATSRSER